MNANFLKPRKTVVTVLDGLQWRDDGQSLYQVKEDGEFSTRTGDGSYELAVEQMRDGRFVAFDIIQHPGQDIRTWPLRERWGLLNSLQPQIERTGGRIVESSPNGAELLQRVLANGGEGIVRKIWNAPYGHMEACKRIQTWRCAVTGFCGGTQSVTIAILPPFHQPHNDAELKPSGRLPLRGGKCDQVRIGSIIKVEGLGLTAAGLIREPRPCKDTPTSWLLKF